MKSVRFPLETSKRRNRNLYPTFSCLINARDDEFITLMETVRFYSIGRHAFMICFRLTTINEGNAIALNSSFMLRATQNDCCAFFDLILDRRLFANDFIIDVLFYDYFFFSNVRLDARMLLDFRRVRDAALTSSAYCRAYRRVFTTSTLYKIITRSLLIRTFRPLLTSRLTCLRANRMDRIFLVSFNYTFIRAFRRF